MVRYNFGLFLFAATALAQTLPAPAPAAATPAATPAAPATPSASPTPSPVELQLQAAAKQRAASQVQTGSAPEGSFFSSGWVGPSLLQQTSMLNCPPMNPSESDPLVAKAASEYKLNPDLLKALIRQESGFHPCAVSDKGAMGLMQLMPDTAATLKTGDPFDPARNIDSGARYLKQMLARFKGDLKLALAAYNAGPEKVDGPKPSVPDIPETRDYVDQIVKSLNGAPAETAP